jgi:lipopolysaccharide biosynthesis glycosyltransferase
MHSSIPLDIIPLKDYELRRLKIYERSYKVESNGQKIDDIDKRPFSTEFAFTRFAIPIFDESPNWVVFCDADFLWRRDIAELMNCVDDDKYLMCVQHDYNPPESSKFDGMLQQKYDRKNWSSLMLMRPRHIKIDKETLNKSSGRYLHTLSFIDDKYIGALPPEWNWLEGHSTSSDPCAVHYTRGTPDMLGKLPFDDEWWNAVNSWKPTMNRHEIA